MLRARESQIHFRWHRLLSRRSKRGDKQAAVTAELQLVAVETSGCVYCMMFHQVSHRGASVQG